MNATIQTVAEMCDVIRSAKSGDRLKVVFANKTFDGDLKGRLYFILYMISPTGNAIGMSEGGMHTLKAVADSGRWEGFREYRFTVLGEFDPDYFIRRTIGRELLESINKVE